MKLWPHKDPAERFPLAFDFRAELGQGDIITDAAVTVTVTDGADAAPGAMIYGAKIIDGQTVLQWCTAGLSGVSYLWRCDATISDGKILSLAAILPVRRFT